MRAALDRLAEVGLQSDAEFAETFARSKWRQSKWGPRRIQQVRACCCCWVVAAGWALLQCAVGF